MCPACRSRSRTNHPRAGATHKPPTREMTVAALADLPAVLAFYHREFAARGWAEQGSAPLAPGDEVALKFSSPEENGVLHLGRKYDFTMVHLTAQVKESVLAARAKAKKDADDQFMKDAEAMTKQVLADDAARRKTQAAALSDAPLQAQAGSTTPVPLPENAQEVDFDGDGGRLEFNATSSVKALAAFYRASLKQAGWKEQPSVINQPNMAVMEFSKGGKSISMTVMQMGPKVNVSADGSGLDDGRGQSCVQGQAGGQRSGRRAGQSVRSRWKRIRNLRCPCRSSAHRPHLAPQNCPASRCRSAASSTPACPPGSATCWRSIVAS